MILYIVDQKESELLPYKVFFLKSKKKSKMAGAVESVLFVGRYKLYVVELRKRESYNIGVPSKVETGD